MSAENVAIVVVMSVAVAVGFITGLVVEKTSNRAKMRVKEDVAETDAKRELDRIRQARDHQLNHGRRVFNWLRGLGFPEYISIEKFEGNDGRFLIHINRLGYQVFPVVHLSYDFVKKHSCDREGHVHYGFYGADADFCVLDHTDFNFGLEDLVVKHVRSVVKEYEEQLASR